MRSYQRHYPTRLPGPRPQDGAVQVYANLPLPLASALDLAPGETVTWKVVERTHLLLARLPERKPLLALAEAAQKAYPEQAESRAAAALLERLIAQDVEEKPEGGCQINEETEKDRVLRATQR